MQKQTEDAEDGPIMSANRIFSSAKKALPAEQPSLSPEGINKGSERCRSQYGKSLPAASFRGRGLNVTWDKSGDKMDSDSGGYMDEMLEEIFGEDEDEEIGGADDKNNVANNIQSEESLRGYGIKDKYVFVLEVLSDQHFRLAMAAIYFAYIAYITVRYAYEMRISDNTYKSSIFPQNATDDDFICRPELDGTCVPNQKLTVGQASLLVNTFVVSDGINVTEWDGDRAKPGTSPVSAFSASGILATDPSVLEPGANIELKPVWDNIVAVIWSGYSNRNIIDMHEKYFLSFEFKKILGTWSVDAKEIKLRIHTDSFSCVRGGENFCDNIGHWRIQDQTQNIKASSVSVKGDILSFSMGHNAMLGGEYLERLSKRIVFSSENGESISDCLQQNNCIVSTILSGIQPHRMTVTWILFLYFIIYLVFFIWWQISLHKRKGRPKMWPGEDWWLVAAGVGLILRINILRSCLDLSMMYSKNFSFPQKAYAAAAALTDLGLIFFMFSLACFIDSPRKYIATNKTFYGYKVFFLLMLYTCNVIIIVYRYPQSSGRDEPGTDSEIGGVGYGTSVSLWNNYDRTLRICAVSLWFSFITIGVIYYVWKSFVGFRLLDNLPYGMTRHTQLSFRFFWYASMFWISSEYVIVCYEFFKNLSDKTGSNDVAWSLSIAYYFRRDVDIAGTSFQMVFTMILQIFFLPLFPNSSVEKSRTYYVSEDDRKHCLASKQSKTNYPMILEKAKLLCICSIETYFPFDAAEMLKWASVEQKPKTKSPKDEKKKQASIQPVIQSSKVIMSGKWNDGKQSSADLSDDDSHGVDIIMNSDPENPPLKEVPGLRLAGEMVNGDITRAMILSESTWAAGCRLIARVQEPVNIHDTKVLILRHEFSGDLIVAFRGTATTKQIKTDLMMSKIGVNMDTFLTSPGQTQKLKNRINSAATLLAHVIEGDLNTGKIANVRLFDLLPKDNEELPPYLNDLHKNPKRIPGKGNIHFGFWSSYNRVRRELHQRIREELTKRPSRLIITGHSLGGAQATLCAYDMCQWVVPTVKRQLLCQIEGGRKYAEKIVVSCYTFGSPKVGDSHFAAAYNKVVPDTQRIVCDGDVITTGPTYMGYHHVKRENIFDFTGTVRAEPGLMEKKYSLKSRNRPNSHRMTNYLKVIKKAFDPMISEEELLNIMRKIYNIRK